MKTNVTITEITNNLVKVFSNASDTAEYNKPGEVYEGFCGWCGVMSPVSRGAYIKTFGDSLTLKAEQAARTILDDNETRYQQSHHSAHKAEAIGHKIFGSLAPSVGSFVFGVHTGLKCDDGRGIYGEIEAAATYCADTMANRAEDLCKVCAVYEVSAEDFARPELADELVKSATERGEEFPGGANNDDTDRVDLLNEYRYYYTECAAVVCKASGRWFLINSEGYSYARYILMPTTWRTMYADEVAEAERKEAERKEAEARKAEEERAARRAEYNARCEKYAGRLEDITPFAEAADNARTAHGWQSEEYKKADRALSAVRRRNLIAMGQTVFPGLKIRAKKSDRYTGAYDVTYFDGPRLEKFEEATDYDLFTQAIEYFDGYTDSTEFAHSEFTDFAALYMGVSYGDVKTFREWSAATRDRLISDVVAAVPGSALEAQDYNNPYKWTREDIEKVAERTGANLSYLLNRWEDCLNYYRYITAENVAGWCFACTDFDTPTTPTGPEGKGSKKSTAATDSGEDTAPADGLQLVELAEGVAVVGQEWKDTYFNKKAIKAHGARWNKEAKRWEATAAEDVETLRRWFALREPRQDVAEDATGEEITRGSDGIERTADGLEFRAVIVSKAAEHEIINSFLTMEEAHAAGWCGDALNPDDEITENDGFRGAVLLFECCRPEDAGTERIAYGDTREQAAARYRAEWFGLRHALAELPEWVRPGVRFVLLDFVTGEPTQCRYTCAEINTELKTVTIPEASDTTREGSHVYPWNGFHWTQFAPVIENL